MTERLSLSARPFIERIEALEHNPPEWDQPEVMAALDHQYYLLELPLPDVEVVPDLQTAWKMQQFFTWDEERDGRFDLLMAGSVMDEKRANEALDVIHDLPIVKAANDLALEAMMLSGIETGKHRFYSTLTTAGYVAVTHNQRGLMAMNHDARQLTLVAFQDLHAAEHGLGWYWPMEEKLILVPMGRIAVSAIYRETSIFD